MFLHYGDMTDSNSLLRVIQETEPTEIYNLAAQSHVGVSFANPGYTADVNAFGPLRVLEAMQVLKLGGKARFYQASTSEMYGKEKAACQGEFTPFHPCNPYGIAKLFGYWTTVNYREAYGFHASNGILFNHESPRRGETFVTRKITRAVARIEVGLQSELYLGNLNARRDWGHARDYVEGMWRMLQQETPADYVLATGETHTVREFVEAAFGEVGRRLYWAGSGVEEVGIDGKSGVTLVRVDPLYFRPSDVELLQGDASKARTRLGWEPTVTFRELIAEMVAVDLQLARAEANR